MLKDFGKPWESRQRRYAHHRNFGYSDIIDMSIPLNEAPLTPPRGSRNVIDLTSPSPPAREVKFGSKGSTTASVGDSLPTPVRDPELSKQRRAILKRINSRRIEDAVMKNLISYLDMILKSDDFNALQSYVVDMCRTSKAQNKLEMLYEALHRWMLRHKRLIPRDILSRIARQIEGYKHFHHVELFRRKSKWLIFDDDYSLNNF